MRRNHEVARVETLMGEVDVSVTQGQNNSHLYPYGGHTNHTEATQVLAILRMMWGTSFTLRHIAEIPIQSDLVASGLAL